jgi:hypothetical protein
MPDRDAVVAVTAQSGDFQGELNAIWDNLLPAFHSQPVPEDFITQESLKRAIEKLVTHPEKKK